MKKGEPAYLKTIDSMVWTTHTNIEPLYESCNVRRVATYSNFVGEFTQDPNSSLKFFKYPITNKSNFHFDPFEDDGVEYSEKKSDREQWPQLRSLKNGKLDDSTRPGIHYRRDRNTRVLQSKEIGDHDFNRQRQLYVHPKAALYSQFHSNKIDTGTRHVGHSVTSRVRIPLAVIESQRSERDPVGIELKNRRYPIGKASNLSLFGPLGIQLPPLETYVSLHPAVQQHMNGAGRQDQSAFRKSVDDTSNQYSPEDISVDLRTVIEDRPLHDGSVTSATTSERVSTESGSSMSESDSSEREAEEIFAFRLLEFHRNNNASDDILPQDARKGIVKTTFNPNAPCRAVGRGSGNSFKGNEKPEMKGLARLRPIAPPPLRRIATLALMAIPIEDTKVEQSKESKSPRQDDVEDRSLSESGSYHTIFLGGRTALDLLKEIQSGKFVQEISKLHQHTRGKQLEWRALDVKDLPKAPMLRLIPLPTSESSSSTPLDSGLLYDLINLPV